MNNKIKLTPELENQILASIRAGGFPHVAAKAWGVPDHVFDKWMEWGTGKKHKAPYTQFARKVEQAKAQARLKAEMMAMEEDPRFWLKNGPGKETPQAPGWSAVVRPQLTNNTNTINLFASPDFLQFLATLRGVLAPYPDALHALTKALDGPAPEPPPPPMIINVEPSNN